MTHTYRLRQLIKRHGLTVAPGAYDCITAKMIQQCGFDAVYMTGAGTAAALGYPDFGLVTMTEMVENAARIVSSVELPVISDADTGYGNELNVYRTVQEFERRGIAAIHLEDQEFPKKCGHLSNKQVISREDYLTKIRAAVAARENPDFCIIARTDARAVLGFDEAVARANAALSVGADLAFVEAPESLAEIEAVPRMVHGPCLFNVVRRGKSPDVDLDRIEAAGYKLAIVPGLLFKSVIGMCEKTLGELRSNRRHPTLSPDLTVREVFQRFGADEWDRLRTRFRDPGETSASRQDAPAQLTE